MHLEKQVCINLCLKRSKYRPCPSEIKIFDYLIFSSEAVCTRGSKGRLWDPTVVSEGDNRVQNFRLWFGSSRKSLEKVLNLRFSFLISLAQQIYLYKMEIGMEERERVREGC